MVDGLVFGRISSTVKKTRKRFALTVRVAPPYNECF